MAKYVGAGKRLSILKNITIEKNFFVENESEQLQKSFKFKIR